MKKKKQSEKVYFEEVFLSDGFVMYKTEPPVKKGKAFRVFVKRENGWEMEIPFSTNHFNKILVGEEIQKELTRDEFYKS